MTAITIPNTFIPSTTISSTEMNDNFLAVAAAIMASVALDGSDTMTGALKAANGTAGTPSISFGTDPNTGIYRRGNDDLAISTNGGIAAHIDSSGRLILSQTDVAAITGASSLVPSFQMLGTSGSASTPMGARFSADASGPGMQLLKSRNATVGSHTIVQSADTLGTIAFAGSDGSAYIPAAQISAAVDGTPGANDMPGRLVFATTADGAASASERLRIDSQGFAIFTNATTTPPTLAVNSQFTFTLTSNTNLRVSARGTDGTTRVFNIGPLA